MRLLIIADNMSIVTTLRRRLWREGHAVDVAFDGDTGLMLAESSAYDAIILDTMLRDMDGVTLTRRLRAAGSATPILMIATRATVSDRLRGLDAGADDYLTAPFAFAELAARLRAITRRGRALPAHDHCAVGDLVLDERTRVVTRGRRVLKLAPREFALLEYLMRHPGQVITRAALLEHVWDYDFDPRTNAVDAAIKRLRKAVDAGAARPLIHTVRGVGYKIQDGV